MIDQILSDLEMESFLIPFSSDEVLIAQKQMKGRKAPGPDGLQVAIMPRIYRPNPIYYYTNPILLLQAKRPKEKQKEKKTYLLQKRRSSVFDLLRSEGTPE